METTFIVTIPKESLDDLVLSHMRRIINGGVGPGGTPAQLEVTGASISNGTVRAVVVVTRP